MTEFYKIGFCFMLTYTKFILFLMRGENHSMSHNNQKKIAVINDFSGFGRCSIAVALPIISAMKIQCCPIPKFLLQRLYPIHEAVYCRMEKTWIAV